MVKAESCGVKQCGTSSQPSRDSGTKFALSCVRRYFIKRGSLKQLVVVCYKFDDPMSSRGVYLVMLFTRINKLVPETLIQMLFENRDTEYAMKMKPTLLVLASRFRSIWRGPNVNCTDSSGYTALHHAALNGHKDIVLKLLQYEASTNVADNKGYFPIHLAAWKGDVEIVKILIHQGPSHSRVNEQ
ncbi:hypothetical protein STEG23_016500, partial [Scotinomys teguina]